MTHGIDEEHSRGRAFEIGYDSGWKDAVKEALKLMKKHGEDHIHPKLFDDLTELLSMP
jgi:hypothetical protein